MSSDNPTALRQMAEQCRSLASSRQTQELRDIFLQMAHRYDAQAAQGEAGSVGIRSAQFLD